MKHQIDPTPYRFDGSQKFSVKTSPTSVGEIYKDKKQYLKHLADTQEQLDEVQQKMYADDRYSALIIFQAMDAAGKDGAIRAVFSGVNPQGTEFTSFKQPGSSELAHSYYWRSDKVKPPRGHFGVFNRSQYEEVLIARVHPELVIQCQRLPANKTRDLNRLWDERYRQLRDSELSDFENGMVIVKFFLHVSKDEQARRFLARIDEPEKNWKFNEGDVKERGFWDDYMKAYEEAINATAAPHAPWYVIPADDKKSARLLVAAAVLHEMQSLPIEWPEVSDERRVELMSYRETLAKELPAE